MGEDYFFPFVLNTFANEDPKLWEMAPGKRSRLAEKTRRAKRSKGKASRKARRANRK